MDSTMQILGLMSFLLFMSRNKANSIMREKIQTKDISKCKSWEEARYLCRACNTRCELPVIKSTSDYKHTVKTLKEKDIDAAWLGLQRNWLGEFLWLDCTRPTQRFTISIQDNNYNCAYINTNNQSLEAAKCHENDKGVICQARGCARCSNLGIRSKDCISINGICYIRKYHDLNWETAKAFCLINGWEMAILGEEQDILSTLSKVFPGGARDVDQRAYWIGLRREEWAFINAGPPVSSYWSPGEPKSTGNCSIIQKLGTGYFWRTVKCTSKYYLLCLGKESTDKPSVSYSRTNELAAVTENSLKPIHEVPECPDRTGKMSVRLHDDFDIALLVLLSLIFLINALHFLIYFWKWHFQYQRGI